MGTAGSAGNRQATIVVVGLPQRSVAQIKNNLSTDLSRVYAVNYATVSELEVHLYDALVIQPESRATLEKTCAFIKKCRANDIKQTFLILIKEFSIEIKNRCLLAGASECMPSTAGHVQIADTLKLLLSDSDNPSNPHLVLNRSSLLLKRNQDTKLTLSYFEMRVLESLTNIQGHTLSRDEIAGLLEWDQRHYEARTLDKFISRLRNKIKKSFNLDALQCVRGFGYKLSKKIISEE